MVRTEDWKYVHWQGYAPQLFNLKADPEEFHDLGTDAAHESVRAGMHQRLFDWFCNLKRRTTVSREEVERGTDRYKEAGVFYGVW
jgi:hypothetical protein